MLPSKKCIIRYIDEISCIDCDTSKRTECEEKLKEYESYGNVLDKNVRLFDNFYNNCNTNKRSNCMAQYY